MQQIHKNDKTYIGSLLKIIKKNNVYFFHNSYLLDGFSIAYLKMACKAEARTETDNHCRIVFLQKIIL